MPPVYIVCFNFLKSLNWVSFAKPATSYSWSTSHSCWKCKFQNKKTKQSFCSHGKGDIMPQLLPLDPGLFTWRVQFAASVKLENDDDHLEFCKNQLIQVKQKMFQLKQVWLQSFHFAQFTLVCWKRLKPPSHSKLTWAVTDWPQWLASRGCSSAVHPRFLCQVHGWQDCTFQSMG